MAYLHRVLLALLQILILQISFSSVSALQDIDGNEIIYEDVELWANFLCDDGRWYDTLLAISTVPFEEIKLKVYNRHSFASVFTLTDKCGQASTYHGNTPYISFYDPQYNDRFCLTNHKDYISTSNDFDGTQRHEFVYEPCHQGKVCYKMYSTANGDQYGMECRTGNIRTYFHGEDPTYFYFRHV